jgi:hypothetical protein
MNSQARPIRNDGCSAVLQHAIRYGWMSENQYRAIAETLLAASGSNLLVFGLGHDAFLWWHCSRGRAVFVEDNLTYLTSAPYEAQVVSYRYPSRVDTWSDIPSPPRLIGGSWDYVLVDGPSGYSPHCPGRLIPIAWAKQLARHQIFVHDYERPWEREVCDVLLGHPVQVLEPSGTKRGLLAIFNVEDDEIVPLN